MDTLQTESETDSFTQITNNMHNYFQDVPDNIPAGPEPAMLEEPAEQKSHTSIDHGTESDEFGCVDIDTGLCETAEMNGLLDCHIGLMFNNCPTFCKPKCWNVVRKYHKYVLNIVAVSARGELRSPVFLQDFLNQ